jgi:hypothetical protein
VIEKETIGTRVACPKCNMNYSTLDVCVSIIITTSLPKGQHLKLPTNSNIKLLITKGNHGRKCKWIGEKFVSSIDFECLSYHNWMSYIVGLLYSLQWKHNQSTRWMFEWIVESIQCSSSWLKGQLVVNRVTA